MFKTIAAGLFAAACVATVTAPTAHATSADCPDNSICLYDGPDGTGNISLVLGDDQRVIDPAISPSSARNTWDPASKCIGLLYDEPNYNGEETAVDQPIQSLDGPVMSALTHCE